MFGVRINEVLLYVTNAFPFSLHGGVPFAPCRSPAICRSHIKIEIKTLEGGQ